MELKKRLDQIGLGKLSMKAHYMDYHITLSGKSLRLSN